ncbi:hypothetical protein [Nonomuraea sp. NPDC049646]|uniref:hypothetical protein n=1 Tax=unclassified Nonomuraea TaxID=2593643 RepID=UPI0037B0ADCD
MSDQRCPDCHVQPGRPHDLGCDVARCPACGIQLIQCEAHGGDRTLDGLAVWAVAAPAVADDYRQRCHTAAQRAALANTDGVTSTSHLAWISSLVDAVLAVRDQDMETLRSENEDLRKRVHEAEADARHLRTELLVLKPELARLRENANRPGCVGCMEREHQRELWAERSRQNGISYEQAKQRWYEAKDRAEDAKQEVACTEAVIEDLTKLVRDLTDPGLCEDFDHHGHCQTHGWLQDGECPHARARDILTAQEAGERRE